MSPSGTSTPVSSPTQGVQAAGEDGAAGVDADDREALGPGFFSAISWAIRLSVRRRSSRSSTTFSLNRSRLHASRSFLASLDRVKGTDATRLAASAVPGEALRTLFGATLRLRRSCLGSTSPRSRAPLRTSCGSPRSGKGSSMTSKSRGAIASARTPPWPRRGPRPRGSGRRCGPGRGASRPASRRPRRPGRRSSGRFRQRAGPPPRRSSRRGPAARRPRRPSRSPWQGAVSPVITTVRPGRGSPITCSGATGPPSPRRSRPPAARPKSGPSRHPEPLRRLGVEAARDARPRPAHSRGADAVLDREGSDLVAVAGKTLPRLDLDQLEPVAGRPTDPPEGQEEVPSPRGP